MYLYQPIKEKLIYIFTECASAEKKLVYMP